jgi:hypothetical protein
MAIVNDETSRILAEHSPEKWREYALMEAKRVFREAREAAKAAFRLAVPEAAGHDLVTTFAIPGTAAHDALVAAIQDAKAEYDQTCGQIHAEFARVIA